MIRLLRRVLIACFLVFSAFLALSLMLFTFSVLCILYGIALIRGKPFQPMQYWHKHRAKHSAGLRKINPFHRSRQDVSDVKAKDIH